MCCLTGCLPCNAECGRLSLNPCNVPTDLPSFPCLCSSAKLAFNYSQWQLFFGLSDMGQQLQAAREQALQGKLAERPQLLAAHVEELVANYYEIANMLGCQVGM